VPGFRLQVSGHRPQVTGHRKTVSSSGFRISCWLLVALPSLERRISGSLSPFVLRLSLFQEGFRSFLLVFRAEAHGKEVPLVIHADG